MVVVVGAAESVEVDPGGLIRIRTVCYQFILTRRILDLIPTDLEMTIAKTACWNMT